MESIVARLTEAYRAQLRVYERMLELARRAEDVAREGRPLAQLHALNVEKRAALAEIEALERRIEADKNAWRAAEKEGSYAHELDGVLAELRRVIEAILAHEQETDRWVLRVTGLRQPNAS